MLLRVVGLVCYLLVSCFAEKFDEQHWFRVQVQSAPSSIGCHLR